MQKYLSSAFGFVLVIISHFHFTSLFLPLWSHVFIVYFHASGFLDLKKVGFHMLAFGSINCFPEVFQ
jgi:hypothetical protein